MKTNTTAARGGEVPAQNHFQKQMRYERDIQARRHHNHAINRAYDELCALCGKLGLSWCMEKGATVPANVVENPSERGSGKLIILSGCGLVELHPVNVPRIGGGLGHRWNFSLVEVGGSEFGHDAPPPSVDESEPMPLEKAIRAFAAAAFRNRLFLA